MWQGRILPLDHVDRRGEGRKRKEREEEGRKRSFTFSLVFPAIGPSVFVGAREKVLPRGKSFK